MKKIEITADWILDELPITHYADGNGNITLVTDSISDSNWIDLALNTLGIRYESDMFDNDPELGERYIFEIWWEFKIEDIKNDCPKLYANWKKMDLINSVRKN